MATLIPVSNFPYQLMDDNGDPHVGVVLTFFLDGTTTPTELFTSDGTSIGTSIKLDALGMPGFGGNRITLHRDQSKAIFIIAKTSGGATIYNSGTIPAVASFDATAAAKLDGIEEGADVTSTAAILAAGALPVDGTGAMTGDLVLGSGAYIKWSVTSAIVASTTQTQAGATVLAAAVNEVGTVANNNDTVRLPTLVIGRQVIVINNGVNILQIFPPTSGTINGGAVNASTTAASGSNIIFVAVDSVNWEAV